MACLNLFNNEQQGACASMGPRISFSNDFVDTQQVIKQESTCREAPVSSDFEFSVSTYSMISADELFCKGKLLPKMTLRDELLVNDEYEDVLPKLPKAASAWWKERLGLKRTHIVPNKAGKSVGSLETIDEAKRDVMVLEEVCANNTDEMQST